MREIARLSTFVRAYGHVCHPDDKFLDDDEDIIEKKREAEILKRRILAKRKAEEEGKPEDYEGKSLFGDNIPFHCGLREIKHTDEEFSHLTRHEDQM